jgi:alkylation response protein AidB-like acyl-CoA dehydrogenase
MSNQVADRISLEAFADECRRFLDARYEPKRRAEAFQWGKGPDRVAVFEETDRQAEKRHIEAVRAWRKDLFEAGLGWITGPPELGGRGLPAAYQRAFDELSRSYDTPGNQPLTVSLGMVAPTVMTHGMDETRERVCPALQNGDLIACQLFSEPGAGSDLAAVSTRAVRDGDGWRLTGQKVWTSGAHFSDIGEILCRTSDGPRHRNLTMFLVDMKAPGVEVRPLRQMTGGAAFNEVFLNDVWVPDENRLGDVNDGWRVALTTLSNERNAIGGEGFGGSGLLDVARYIAMARQFGRDGDPIVRQEIAALYSHLRVARLTGQRARAGASAGRAPGPEASIGKLALAENFARLSHLVGVILGPRLTADTGEWGTYAWNDVILGVPGYRLGGGTDEVLRNILAERVLGLPKEPTGSKGPAQFG